jgi:hypothetical protein
MISLVSRKAPKGESPSVSTSVKLNKPKPAGRERLVHFDSELAKANAAAVEIEEKIARLEAILADAEAHHQNLQLAILIDGGVALSNYSAGKESDDSDIGKLVLAERKSAQAKPAAEAALPKAQADLKNVREQAIKLNESRNAELNRVVSNLADVEAVAYAKAFRELARLHDRLVGYCRSGAESNLGDIQLIVDPLKTPRFALPSLGNSDADPFIRHALVNDHVANEAARYWRSVRARLESDSEADLSDLI